MSDKFSTETNKKPGNNGCRNKRSGAMKGLHNSMMAKQTTTCSSNSNNNNNKSGHSDDTVSAPAPEEADTGGYFFLNADACRKLPEYQYKGEDRSLIYKYVLSPLAAFLVNHCTPSWLAPNAVTFIGLMWMVAAYGAIWYYVPSLAIQANNDNDVGGGETDDSVEDNVPRWIFLLNFIGMLVYQTLDNMDGKQARRTGSSSPLGMLFDHGCDAINSVAGSANWIVTLSLDPFRDAILCWAIVLGPMAMFFIATWEEYYTGALILPIINGVNEGLIGGALLSLASFLYGPTAFWQDTGFYDSFISPYLPTTLKTSLIPTNGLRNADLQVMVASFCIVREYIDRTIVISSRYGIRSLRTQLPFLSLCVLLLTVVDIDLWVHMPRTTLHLCSGLFVELVTQMMLDHITKQRYQPLRWLQIPLVVLPFLTTTSSNSNIDDDGHTTIISANDFLLIYAACLWTFLAVKIRIVIHECCAVLGIWCFDIITPRPKQKVD